MMLNTEFINYPSSWLGLRSNVKAGIHHPLQNILTISSFQRITSNRTFKFIFVNNSSRQATTANLRLVNVCHGVFFDAL